MRPSERGEKPSTSYIPIMDSPFLTQPPTTETEILAAIAMTRRELDSITLDAQTAMQIIAEQAQFLTDSAGAVIELLEINELVYRAASGTATKSLGLRVDTKKSMSGLCFRTGETLRCDDTETDDRVDKAACRWVGIRSMVLVPLVHSEQRLGVLAVISPAVSVFKDRDVWILQHMSATLSGALVRHISR
jgi:GAF domain-containing protein